ncbi:MAG TPA: DUF502 domain-containing protein [Tepidisphaeraceae bacterium]|jgi:uncharacterized membrane protein|nr:DUF502 domain-containing protein [Tepidisphaeraceae bacterium]
MIKPRQPARPRLGFGQDFRRFFVRGLAALLPTLITLWLLIKVWDFLWESLGRYMIWGVKSVWWNFGNGYPPATYIQRYWSEEYLRTKVVGVLLAVLLVYILGVFVGNFIGRTLYRLGEMAVLRIPLVRAIYPAVKQVTDFLLAERGGQFEASRVVAVQPHAKGIWSIGLVTGSQGIRTLTDAVGHEMVTVFIPSSPTAFTGYVLVVPKDSVVELPLSVEEAMRLLVSGGVLTPKSQEQSPGEPPDAQEPASAPSVPLAAQDVTTDPPLHPGPGARLAND